MENSSVYWLIAKDQAQAWAPAYIITGNRAELDFLREKGRIPKTMSFLYEKVVENKTNRYACGIVHIPGLFTLDSPNGMPTPAYENGTSPYAIKGNGVIFDVSTITEKWWNTERKEVGPPVFDAAKKPFQLSPNCLYYCVSDGDSPTFQCIDLLSLKIRK